MKKDNKDKKNIENYIIDKNKLINVLSQNNFSLDMIRNGIYNIVSSLNYVRDLKIEKELIETISIGIMSLNNNINVLVSQLNLKFGNEVKNENKSQKKE